MFLTGLNDNHATDLSIADIAQRNISESCPKGIRDYQPELPKGRAMTNPPTIAAADRRGPRLGLFKGALIGVALLNASSPCGADDSGGRRPSLRQRLPILRWSFWRMTLGARKGVLRGQAGDGREAAAADFVLSRTRHGDIDGVLEAFDTFAYERSLLMNVGDEKGRLLDSAVRRADPRQVLELGTYIGYSALRIARAAPSAHVFSIEMSEANAAMARRIWAHAAVSDRVTCVLGRIGDGGTTTWTLSAEHGFAPGGLDFLFLDHNKNDYVDDLTTIVGLGWLRHDAIVLADNIVYPGAPKYRRYMREQQGKLFDTVKHKTHLEYQTLIPDLMLESRYIAT
jgi:catechol O-methyltransferase